MGKPRSDSDDFAGAFESAFARLQVALEEACGGWAGWPERIAAAVRAGFEFAAADPGAAQLLTSGALASGRDGVARHERFTAYLAAGLAPGREQRPEGERLPEMTERALASGVAMLVAQRVDSGKEAELPALVPEAVQFVLTPYLGAPGARRVAAGV